VNARPPYREATGAGAAAGLVGSVIQVLVGLLLDRFVLPPRQHNNIAPRFVKRLSQLRGKPAHPRRDWTLGTLFHLGYGIGWGCAFGLARRWSGIPSPLLGGATGLLIYLLAFSGVGVGTWTRTEQHPRRRSWRKQISLVVIAWTFALSTAIVYDILIRRRSRAADKRVDADAVLTARTAATTSRAGR
jgi:hypothetical protein